MIELAVGAPSRIVPTKLVGVETGGAVGAVGWVTAGGETVAGVAPPLLLLPPQADKSVKNAIFRQCFSKDFIMTIIYYRNFAAIMYSKNFNRV
ncbi:MAG: hypothetical protein WCP82_06505 [Alphaproteobacteria bacterium]